MKLLRRVNWITVLERLAVLLGAVLVSIAIGAFDWRLGVGAAGVLLLIAGVDVSGTRRP